MDQNAVQHVNSFSLARNIGFAVVLLICEWSTEYITITDAHSRKAAATDEAASEFPDAGPLAFWGRYGSRAVELLDLQAGESVLDVGCGAGSSALPAGMAVAPTGRVVAIDNDHNVLVGARSKAAALELDNIAFKLADMTSSGYPDRSFDAVLSVFSIFFAGDMERQVSELWRMLRPGGRLGVTIWAPNRFEPCLTVFGEEIQSIRPGLLRKMRPWERLTDENALRRLFAAGGATDPKIHTTVDRQPLSHPEDWWTLALNTGCGWEINQLTEDERALLKKNALRRFRDTGARTLTSSAIHAVAQKQA